MNLENISLADFHHIVPVQLRFNDIDILGHLNNIVYFSLYDLAKARFIREIRPNMPADWRKVDCVIANINCSYIKQVVFGEDIAIKTRCSHIGEKSFTLQQCLFEQSSQEIRSICETVMVCFDPETGRSAPMNPAFREALTSDMTKCGLLK